MDSRAHACGGSAAMLTEPEGPGNLTDSRESVWEGR
jgi:hypothetical protein